MKILFRFFSFFLFSSPYQVEIWSFLFVHLFVGRSVGWMVDCLNRLENGYFIQVICYYICMRFVCLHRNRFTHNAHAPTHAHSQFCVCLFIGFFSPLSIVFSLLLQCGHGAIGLDEKSRWSKWNYYAQYNQIEILFFIIKFKVLDLFGFIKVPSKWKVNFFEINSNVLSKVDFFKFKQRIEEMKLAFVCDEAVHWNSL